MHSSLIKFGKRASVIAALALLAATTSAIPASAAVKPGDRCKKAGATLKIKGDKYVCTKNPRYKKSLRVWVWDGCIEANTLYSDSVTRLENLKAGLVAATAKLDELVKEVPEAEIKAKEYDAKIAETQIKLTAAKKSYDENLAKGAAYANATNQWKNAVASYERAIASFTRAAKSLRDKADDVTAQQKRLDLQNQTIAASEVEIQSNLKGRNQACQKGL